MYHRLCKFTTTLVFVVLGSFAATVLAQAPNAPLVLKPDAPDRYVVVPGDTLWGIAERFTDAPWRWTELWSLNKDQIKDPHRIYPGNVILLDRDRSRLALAPTIKLTPKIRAEATAELAIPSIPPNLLEPFLSRPLVIEADGLDNAPSIIATQDDRVVLDAGSIAYVKGIGKSAEDSWHLYRRGGPLVDPATKRILGYEAIHLGTARVETPGEPAKIQIITATQEVSKGDRLVAAGRPNPVNYAPRAPFRPVKGQVMSIYGGVGQVGEAGRHSIITLNRGVADGLELGHVLALSRLGNTVVDSTLPKGDPAANIKLPDERYGLVFVFRVFDRVSYAIVMHVTKSVRPLDVVQNP